MVAVPPPGHHERLGGADGHRRAVILRHALFVGGVRLWRAGVRCAYDSSDITGDRGVSGSLELRYNGYATLQPISLQPYAFYDIGEVWNDAIGQVKSESGASAGLGIRGNGPYGLNGNLGLAWPLTREIATPLYPGGKEGPRILLQVSKGF